MSVRELFEQRAEQLKTQERTPRQMFEERAMQLEKEKEKSKKIAKQFKFFGRQPFTPEQIQKVRKPIKQEAVNPLIDFFAGRFGVPGDVLESAQRIAGVEEPIETLPSSERLKKSVEKLAGEEFRPETQRQEKIGQASSLAGALSLGKGKGRTAKAISGAGVSVGLQNLLEELGLPKSITEPVGIASSIFPFLFPGGGGAKIPKKTTELGKIAREEFIAAPKAAVAKKFPKRRVQIAKVTEKTAQRERAFEKSVERAKDRIIEGVTPLAKNEAAAEIARKEGGAFLDKARETAKSISTPVPTPHLSEALNKNIKILTKSPALATEEKGTLKFLTDISEGIKGKIIKDTKKVLPKTPLEHVKSLLKTPALIKKKEITAKEFQKLLKRKIKPKIIKKILPKDKLTNLTALNTSLNKEIRFLKPTTSGDKALLDVKTALMEDVDIVAPRYPKFFEEWKAGNKLFSQGKKFEQIREALSPAFTEDGINFNKFRTIFRDPKKQKGLVKLLGKEQFGRLKNISKLGKASSDAFKEISKDPRMFRQLERMGNFAILGAAMGKSLTGIQVILTEKVGVRLLRGYMGRVMTDPKFSKNYLNLMKAVKLGTPKAIITTAKRVNEDIENTKKDIRD